MNKLGSNRTKRIYLCPKCETFYLETWQIGDEAIPKTRREYCPRCDGTQRFTLLPLEREKNA